MGGRLCRRHGGLLFGYEIGVIGQVLGFKNFQNDFGTTGTILNSAGELIDNPDKEGREGLITSTFLFGCVAGALVCSFMADIIGRKYSIIAGGALFAAGGVFSALPPPSVPSTLVVSSLVLLSVSFPWSCPLHCRDCPPQIRGRLTTVYQLLITFGIFDKNASIMWRLALGMQVLPAGLLVIAVFFIPSPPLRTKDVNDSEVSPSTMVFVRVSSSSVALVPPTGPSLPSPESPAVRIWCYQPTFQQLTGINVILYYSASIFTNMGFKDASNEFNSVVTFPIATLH
ncbi:hypothetical protein BC829DRAFT_490340 [Chytridium lagenaria]|nr:hypothetical protein BC829DRAFT_490340 [Chytridium lagenaria]